MKAVIYECSAIDELNNREEIELIDCIEGCLIDNLLFYNCETQIYYMCLEYPLNCWSSCYQVRYGTEEEVYEVWDKLLEREE